MGVIRETDRGRGGRWAGAEYVLPAFRADTFQRGEGEGISAHHRTDPPRGAYPRGAEDQLVILHPWPDDRAAVADGRGRPGAVQPFLFDRLRYRKDVRHRDKHSQQRCGACCASALDRPDVAPRGV